MRAVAGLRLGDLAPGLVVGGPAVAIFGIWAGKDAGFSTTTWYPGALFLVALLAVVVLAGRSSHSSIPRAAAIAIALFFAFALWSAVSIAWASHRGMAWDGANRTMLYAAVFALFALVPWRGLAVPLVLVGYAVVVAAIGVAYVARAAYGDDPYRFFMEGRLAAPAGYPNAACALFVIALWPPLYVAGRREVPPVVRGLTVALAAVLAELALLTQSRASLVAVPLGLAVYLAAVPDRMRALPPLLAVAAAVALSADRLFAPYGPLLRYNQPGDELQAAVAAIGITAVALAVTLTLFAVVDQRVRVAPTVVRALRIALVAGCVVSAATLLALFLATSPGRRTEDAWRSFRSGYPIATASPTHFISGLGNNRADFWRVALNEFRDHPVRGIGADNFAEDYLATRRSGEEPLHPHSLELRVLAQTGIVGAVLFSGFLIAAAIAARANLRRNDLAGAVARAGLVATAYWVIHGSIDWFWEFPGLSAPALAWLGLAASGTGSAGDTGVPSRTYSVMRMTAVVAIAVTVVSFSLPWLGDRLEQRAARTWGADRRAAYDDLALARRLNPLSPEPDLIEGAIASRVDDLPRMERAFERALDRDERQWYAHLELALAAASSGRRAEALRHLRRAERLDPREPLIRIVARRVGQGKPVSRASVDRFLIARFREAAGTLPPKFRFPRITGKD